MKSTATDRSGRKLNVLLWALQVLLAILFMFAGVMKFVMPIEEMTKQIPLAGWFLHFIVGAEILGAIALVLPGILRIRTGLTPLAEAALVVIMIGATAVKLEDRATRSCSDDCDRWPHYWYSSHITVGGWRTHASVSRHVDISLQTRGGT